MNDIRIPTPPPGSLVYRRGASLVSAILALLVVERGEMLARFEARR